ncbi:hypothetical protein [uncultured Tateyamaria sp.]|uniref:hypothetical protein n=1 Tax=uncultured Tateyamaria sp. TaxID=455651 RepID=UPI0026395C9D|nr:hypothetical protein [uncultured Tateyamaria sp.]
MENFYFDTTDFRDTRERAEENVNMIEGEALCEFLKTALLTNGFTTDDVFPEDFGWVFYATLGDQRYFVTASLDPADDFPKWDQHPPSNTVMFANINVEKKRGLKEKLLGRNKQTANDPAERAVLKALQNHPAVSELKYSRNDD